VFLSDFFAENADFWLSTTKMFNHGFCKKHGKFKNASVFFIGISLREKFEENLK